MLNILIVEDDPMVASLNEQFVNDIPHTTVVGNCRTTKDATYILETTSVDLILLDVYLPGETGITFLKRLKQTDHSMIPIILITAANDMTTIEEALSFGVTDYLVKPFTFDRFQLAVKKAQSRQDIVDQYQQVTQNKIDLLFNEALPGSHDHINLTEDLPKGLSKLTLKKVMEQINKEPSSFSTEQLAKNISLSRISTKKYLVFLANNGYVTEKMEYREIGRPITLYTKNNA